jgi:hypothetical protein
LNTISGRGGVERVIGDVGGRRGGRDEGEGERERKVKI